MVRSGLRNAKGGPIVPPPFWLAARLERGVELRGGVAVDRSAKGARRRPDHRSRAGSSIASPSTIRRSGMSAAAASVPANSRLTGSGRSNSSARARRWRRRAPPCPWRQAAPGSRLAARAPPLGQPWTRPGTRSPAASRLKRKGLIAGPSRARSTSLDRIGSALRRSEVFTLAPTVVGIGRRPPRCGRDAGSRRIRRRRCHGRRRRRRSKAWTPSCRDRRAAG